MLHKQNKPFYLVNSIGRADDLVDLQDEAPTTFDVIDEAITKAEEIVKEYGLRTYVFKCIPVVRVDLGNPVITKLKGTKQL
jgi:hypothetical protein